MSKKSCHGATLSPIYIKHPHLPSGTNLYVRVCCGTSFNGETRTIPVATLSHEIPTEYGIEEVVACMLSIRGPSSELFCAAHGGKLLARCKHDHNPSLVSSPTDEQAIEFQGYINNIHPIDNQFLTGLRYSNIDIERYGITLDDLQWHIRPITISSAQVGEITTGPIEAFVITKGTTYDTALQILEDHNNLKALKGLKLHFTNADQTILTQLCPPGFSPIGMHHAMIPTMMFARPTYRNSVIVTKDLLLLTD